MRKAFVVLFSLIFAVGVFATGVEEEQEEEQIHLIYVDTGETAWDNANGYWETDGYPSFEQKMMDQFRAENPNVEVTYIHRDVTQGSMTTDALEAKGTPADVRLDASGYFRDKLNSADSLPLEQYTDLSIFEPALLEPYTVDGHVYAVPYSNVTTGLAINLDMLDEIGYTMPPLEEWTTDEFLRLARKLKAAGHPATMIMTKDGMFGWMMPWIYAFGGSLFENGDYSHVTINSPESAEAMRFIKQLVDEGLTIPYPNEQGAGEGVHAFTEGRVFSCLMQTGHVDYWIPEKVKQGAIEEEVNFTFVEFPHGPGVDNTPVYGYAAVLNVRATDDEARNRAAIRLLEMMSGEQYQLYAATIYGAFPTIRGLEVPEVGTAAKPSYQAMKSLQPHSGIMDLGGMHPRSREVIQASIIPTQEFMDGEITAEEMLARWEAEANRILAE